MRLGFVLDTPDGSEVVTGRVSNETLKNSSPGGFASVEFDLVRALDETRLPAKARVRVYDTATGEQVGGGRLVEQGLNDDGTWKIAALGEGIAALQDIDEPYMVIDTELKPYTQPVSVGVKMKTIGRKQKPTKSNTRASIPAPRYKVATTFVMGEAKNGSAPNGSDVEGLLFQVPEGTTVSSGASISASFRGPYQCGMRMAAYGYRYITGATSSGWSMRADAETVGYTSELSRSDSWVATETDMFWRVHTTNFSAIRDAIRLSIRREGATVLVGGNAWAHVRGLVIRSQLYGPTGAIRSGEALATTSARVGEVFTDLIVRRCPTLKLGTIATGTQAFKQLAWYDGITAKDVLDEMCESDGTVTYHAWEADTDGRTTIHLEPLPTKVRYELSTKHGFSAPSPASDAYDTVVVSVRDDDGYVQYKRVSRNTDGNPRSQPINLDAFPPEGLDAVANKFLDAMEKTPNAGTITVAERVLDLWTGRWVHPAAIRSGHLCRVRGVQPTPDTLNPEAKQDGVTIFRIATNTYSDGVATLELDQPVLNADRAIAALLG